MSKFKESDIVKILAKDSPSYNKIGTIIMVLKYPEEAYEIEFVDKEGKTEDTAVFSPNELMLVKNENL